MTVDFRTRNQLLLLAVQSAAGTPATPTPGSNALRAFDVQFLPNLQSISTGDEVTDSLSAPPPIPSGGNAAMRFSCRARGAGTGGDAPDWGAALRTCSMSQTQLAADLTGTAQAGAASAITLAASGPSSTNDAYRGMPIRITGGTGVGQVNMISAYNGTSKVATVATAWTTEPDATSVYSIDACMLYRPITDSPEFATLWNYLHNNDPAEDSIRRRIHDGQGTWTFRVAPAAAGVFTFNYSGVLTAVPDGVTRPSDPTYGGADPFPLLNAQMYLADEAVKISEFTLDCGMSIEQYNDASTELGFAAAQAVGRVPVGQLIPNRVDLASRDAFTDWQAGTSKPFWMRWGAAAGRRVSVFLPAIRYTGNEDADVRGFAAERMPFQATGLDQEVFICVH